MKLAYLGERYKIIPFGKRVTSNTLERLNNNEMKFRLGIFLLGVFIVFAFGCNKQWEEHYNTYPETVDENVWDALQNDPQVSEFVKILKEFQIDTLFNSDIPYTFFAPTNEALSNYLGLQTFSKVIASYHISTHFINSGSIEEKRKVQTLTEKFALFERFGKIVMIDGIEVKYESPLYLNGKYFIMDEVVEPKPNLYEYFEFTNPILSNFIDTQDTIIIDKEKSKPLGFDENGNTIYDTVSVVENKFEWEYFPVKHEFRELSGTIVFPKEEDYRAALNIMAESLGGEYNDYGDIPLDWQTETLLPHLFEQGIFLNMIEPEEFAWESEIDTAKLQNILGDSIVIDYVPVDKALCSNGYAYNYQDFVIPDSLYSGGSKFEGEWLLEETGINRYSWYENVIVKSDIPLEPYQEFVPSASNDSILRVLFPKGYSENFSVEFDSPRLFPRKYVLAIRTHMDVGGIYNIYVNDELVITFDYYDFLLYHGLMYSVTGERYIPEGRFNKFDMWVDNIFEYGKAKIRIEYVGPGNVLSNGLIIDYVEFIPADN